MRVYRLEQDPDRWQCLHPKGARYLNFFSVPDDLEERASRAAGWKPPVVEHVDPDLEESDFSMPDSGALIVNPRGYEVLRPLLAEAGEVWTYIGHGFNNNDDLWRSADILVESPAAADALRRGQNWCGNAGCSISGHTW